MSADLGIALDGDADRVILIDPNGNTIEGDQILYILAKNAINVNKFNSKIVGTILTNSGLEISLKNKGIKLYRSEVGDKNVLQLMRQTGSLIGGENSGHIINLEYSPSGDGLMTALLIMKTMIESEKSLDELLNGLDLIPQLSHNIETDLTKISNDFIAEISDDANTNLKNGRVLIRKSGTEPKIRIMGESYDKNLIFKCINTIKRSIK